MHLSQMHELMHDLRNCPQYTREEEAALCDRMRDGDEEARHLLFLSCIPWAIKWAGEFHARKAAPIWNNMSIEDVVQTAMIGLHESLDKFDSKHGTRLTTYATYWMRQRCWEAVRLNNVIIQPRYMWFTPNVPGNPARRTVF